MEGVGGTPTGKGAKTLEEFPDAIKVSILFNAFSAEFKSELARMLANQQKQAEDRDCWHSGT